MTDANLDLDLLKSEYVYTLNISNFAEMCVSVLVYYYGCHEVYVNVTYCHIMSHVTCQQQWFLFSIILSVQFIRYFIYVFNNTASTFDIIVLDIAILNRPGTLMTMFDAELKT